MILIASKRDGFYRGGVRHPLGVTKYPDGTFTDAQMEKFKREPMLFIEIVPDSKAEASGEVKSTVIKAEVSGEVKPPDIKAEANEQTKTPDKKATEKGESASNAKKKNT